MNATVISAFDANNGVNKGDLFVACGLEIVIKSNEALEVANKVIAEWDEPQLDKATNLVYDSETAGCSDYTHDVMDAIREALEASFGKPHTENRAIEYLGYPETTNEHWGVWSKEVMVDEDNEIVEWVEY